MRRSTFKNLRQTLPGARRVFLRFWPLVRQQRGAVAAACAALVAGVALRLLEPWPLKFVFDRVLQTETRRGGRLPDLPVMRDWDPTSVLAASAVGLVVIVGLRALSDYLSTVLFTVIGNRVLAKVREQTYRHMQRLSMSFHASARGGDLIIRVINDVNQLRDAAVTAVLPLAANTLVLAGMWAMMLWLHWPLALLALAVLPLLWLRTVSLGRRIRDAARKQRHRTGAMASTAAESIAAMKVVQVLSLEDVFAREFAERNEGSRKEDVKASVLSARLERGVDVMIAVATAAVLYYGAVLAVRGTITPGELLVFLAYLRKAFNPVKDFAKYTTRVAKATAAGERVLDVLDRTPDVRDLPGAAPATRLRGDVRFEHVSFGYGDADQPVLDDISFTAEPGEVVALVGPSGAGKSTVANLLLRLYDPQAGRVLVDGRDVREYALDSYRRQLSVVLQDAVLFAASVRGNVAHGQPGVTEAQVVDAARIANADDFVRRLPQGYDTVLTERGATLSGGQRQRIAIARAALRPAPILVLDEPTAGLDEANERDVVAALERLAEGRTTLLITHDLRLAARADRVLYLDAGRVVEEGAPGELFRGDGRFAALYRLQTLETPPRHPEPAEPDPVLAG